MQNWCSILYKACTLISLWLLVATDGEDILVCLLNQSHNDVFSTVSIYKRTHVLKLQSKIIDAQLCILFADFLIKFFHIINVV